MARVAIKGFISYAHVDIREFDVLRQHLKPIERAFGINFWADRRIRPGDYWTTKIADAINDAQITLLILSPAFLASDYIFDHELPAIKARYRSGTLVVPIILRRCMWEPFLGVLQATPTTSKGQLLPITEWSPQSHGFNAAREQIAGAIRDYFGVDTKTHVRWS